MLYLCAGAHCLKPASLSCPTCIKENPNSTIVFCEQDCFKKNWNIHKLLHLNDSTGKIVFNPWPTLKYSGSLRPYPITPMATIPDHIVRPDYANDGIPHSEETFRGSCHIPIQSPEAIVKMRQVCRLAREVLDIAGRAVRPGITTDEIDKIVHAAAIERNCYPSPLNYRHFPKSVCTSVNEVICHGIPDLRPLQNGDLVNIDVTLYHDGFHGDLNETFPVGEISKSSKKLIKETREALYKAIEIVRPGVAYKEIGNIIQNYAASHGFSVVKSYCGHGVHQIFHGPPTVPHYAHNKAKGIMQAGHTFTIEPMICEGSAREVHWQDNWTCLTEDGRNSAQFEHTLLVTDSGCEILTKRFDE